MLPSPRVTANGEPTGRQPWLTTARRSTGPTRATPAAPPSSTSVPYSSRWRPGSVAPDTMPPITGRPGCSALRRSRKLSAGKVNGSASSRTLAWSPSGRSGQPGQPDGQPGHALQLAAAADHPLGGAAEDVGRAGALGQAQGDAAGGVRVLHREEADHQVGGAADLLEGGRDDLVEGLGVVPGGGDGGAEGEHGRRLQRVGRA